MSYNWQQHVRGNRRGRGRGRGGGGGGGRRGGGRGRGRRGGYGGGGYNGGGYGGGGYGGYNNNNNNNNFKNQNDNDEGYDYDYDNNNNNNERVESSETLRSTLISFENKPYNFYKDLRFTEWKYGNDFSLWFDRVQTDPFAPASNLRVRVPMTSAQIDGKYYSNNIRNIACCDWLTRQFYRICREEGYDFKVKGQGWHGKKGGDMFINKPGQHIIQRTSVNICNDYVEARFTCSLPGHGRRIEGRWCADILVNNLPYVVESSLTMRSLKKYRNDLENHIISCQDQEYLRTVILDKMNLAAFVPNGAILPRVSGVDDRPMNKNDAIPFECHVKDPLYTEIEIVNGQRKRKLNGLGIPKGITLIVGGGFHGKSTLLEALQYGVYNHIPGDGREFVSCLSNGVKIRAEDGRSISQVNISPFINNLPQKKSTNNFSTQDASGSTSQAANICEALEIGCNLLLIDEDTCATNFMIRDRNMQLLVSSNKEPITPFISKIRAMYEKLNVSSILVVGGCGAYFQVADNVIMMDNYLPRNLTKEAKAIANSKEFMANNGLVAKNNNNTNNNNVKTKTGEEKANDVQMSITTTKDENESKENTTTNGNLIFEYSTFGDISVRYPDGRSIDGRGKKGDIGIKVTNKSFLSFGKNDIDLSSVSQIVENGQTKAIGKCLAYISQIICRNGQNKVSIHQILRELDEKVLNDLDNLNNIKYARYSNSISHDLVRPRKYEIVAALNRLRSLRLL